MKKFFQLSLLLFLPLALVAGENDLTKLRALYYRAAVDKSAAEDFYACLSAARLPDKVLLSGYTGMSYMIRARYAWNPYAKLGLFMKGKDCLNEAIAADPDNIELRFLRYCAQTNAPAFLAYSGEIRHDKAVILLRFAALKDQDLRSRIKNYMLASAHCPPEEKTVFK